jgi:hypothetical protein
MIAAENRWPSDANLYQRMQAFYYSPDRYLIVTVFGLIFLNRKPKFYIATSQPAAWASAIMRWISRLATLLLGSIGTSSRAICK